MGLLTGIRRSIADVTDRLFADDTPKRIGIYGPPNAGKCLAADEEVMLADGTTASIESLFEDVVRAESAPKDVSEAPNETWLECSETSIRVPALSETLSAVPGEVTHVFRQRYSGPMYRVQTRLGREVTVSPNHPFVAATDTGVETVASENVEEGLPVALLETYNPTRARSQSTPRVATDGGIAVARSNWHDRGSLLDRLNRFDCLQGDRAVQSVPNAILTASDDTVSAFLRALYSCSGTVEDSPADRAEAIKLTCASANLVRDVQLLLLRFGIVGSNRDEPAENEPKYTLEISGSDHIRRFQEQIGFDLESKSWELDRLCSTVSPMDEQTLPWVSWLESVRDGLGMSREEFYGDEDGMRGRECISVDHLTSMASWLPDTAETEVLNRVAASDVYWDEVVSVQRIDYDGYIYDLTVDEHHTFTTATGIIVHNTTLANRIARDWTGEDIGAESHVPHETRRAQRKENVEIKRNGNSVTIDIVDTPGVTTKVDYEEFLEFDIEEDDAVARSREATEGVAEAMHWLREDVDGVIYVLDSAEDPFTQVNTMLIGIIESRDLPVLIFANKIDLDGSSIQRISNAFPQHETVPLSALEGENMDEVYDKIAEYFG